MNVSELTKKLITLQSFDDGERYEKPVSDFLVAYMQERFPWLDVCVQEVAPNRFNIFAKDRAPTRLLVIDQIDTVRPDVGWGTDPLDPVEDSGKIFGLGASDSKGNVAAFLTALEQYGETQGVAILFYVDEEYLFAGMKYFVSSELAKTIDPAWILSIDGNGSMLGRGCRGLVEFDLLLTSPSGHSANAHVKGSLRPFLETERAFRMWLDKRSSDQELASSTQIASVFSGLLVGQSEKGPLFGKEGNRIPNYTQAKIEVRTAPSVSWSDIELFWRSRLSAYCDLEVKLMPVITLSGYLTRTEPLAPIVNAVGSVLGDTSELDLSTFGYLDVAMLQEVYPNAALCSFGIGEIGVNHRANEYVRTEALETGVAVYGKILQNVLT